MPSSKSWFAPASSSKSRLLSNSSHELPRWRDPSPSASMIPPPIVQSTYIPPQNLAAESVFVEKPTELDDRQQQLEADLQLLLDAQAEGLIRGLEGGTLGDRSSTGSTTPTIQSVRSPSARRTRKPIRRQPGLKSARKGIYNSIISLATLKDEELQDIEGEVRSTDETLDQIDDWEMKREGLKEASQNADSSEDTVRVQRLRQEADAMQVEINRVESHLMELKSKHRKLMRQAVAVENSVQAKMASYTNSLRMLEEDIEKFLRFKPEGADSRPTSSDGKASVWQLPPKRRNLDLAKEYWNEQRETTLRQHKNAQFEKTALVEGAALWREAVVELTDFEKLLRSSVRPSSPNSQSAWEDPQPQDANDQSKEVLIRMETLMASLQKKLQTAEERNWKLLMAALGAELDALRRGKEIMTGEPAQLSPEAVETNGHDLRKADSGDEIRALDESFATARPIVHHSDAEDEEPPPELLFSQARDVDTE